MELLTETAVTTNTGCAIISDTSITLRVLEFLTSTDLALFAATCWEALPIALDEMLWSRVCRAQFPGTEILPGANWRETLWRQIRARKYQRAIVYGGTGRRLLVEPPSLLRLHFSLLGNVGLVDEDGVTKLQRALNAGIARRLAPQGVITSTNDTFDGRLARQGTFSWSALKVPAPAIVNSEIIPSAVSLLVAVEKPTDAVGAVPSL
jgi:hypothetical protein